MPRTIVCKELDSSQHDGLVLVATSSIFLANFENNTSYVCESLSSGSNLPHAAITEALNPALKLDKAAESKVGISLCMNHASSPIKQVCNIALFNSLVSCFSTLSLFLLTLVHIPYYQGCVVGVGLPCQRLIFSPTGPVDRDWDDLR